MSARVLIRWSPSESRRGSSNHCSDVNLAVGPLAPSMAIMGVAVHVSNKGCVALLGELPRLVMDVLGDAPPFMHHHDDWMIASPSV